MSDHEMTPLGAMHCRNESALFEPGEAQRNGGECPWCGEEVDFSD